MNKELVKIMFYSSGLPVSAMVVHACLEEDLGFDKDAMAALVSRINTAFSISIPEEVWMKFERVGEIDEYLKNVKNGDINKGKDCEEIFGTVPAIWD